jgi:putative exporter of polyketide antibiotics
MGTSDRADTAPMLQSLLRTIVKVAIASLIVGTILAHFGITIEILMKEAGLSPERLEALFRRSIAWIVPNMALGSLIIVPMWFLVYILRPPGPSQE